MKENFMLGVTRISRMMWAVRIDERKPNGKQSSEYLHKDGKVIIYGTRNEAHSAGLWQRRARKPRHGGSYCATPVRVYFAK